MGAEFGRISGPLLSENLRRNGIDLAFEDDLLYLKVSPAVAGSSPLEDGDPNYGKPGSDSGDEVPGIGINTDVPSSALTVNGIIRTTNYAVETPYTLTTPNYVIGTNVIQNLLSTIYLQPDQSDPVISAVKFGTLNLNISDKLIENITNDSDINLNPTRQVVFNTTLVDIKGVDGDGVSLHATGNITFDGDITFGSDSADNVVFSSDVNSDIIPDADATYTLGSATQSWNTLYTIDVGIDALDVGSLTINGIDLLLTPGKTLYVSVNGDDAQTGTHSRDTFKSVKQALSVATTGDNIVIFPGTYEEEFPLTIPAGVSINGAGIRSVKIVPTALTNDKDCFLLNGETTVSNLTIANFYYNSINDTGYGFRFASGATITSRSPYIQNITIITESPNAGHGALIDGSVVNSSSKEAGMLFHSTTMIVPGAIGIHATNGARVEWLDCFTYFAEKGIYLTQGTLGFANLATKYGAELRSIGSANIYGTYGAVADGANCVGYLISHNFAYIGAGTDTSNDPRLAIQANEIVEVNNGRIYYESVDHKGDLRIGDIFYVNQETGAVVFNAQSMSFNPLGNISLEGPGGSVYIDATQVRVNNIKIYDNNIDSLVGPVNLLAYSGITNLNTNVFVTGNVEVSQDISVDGNVFLGDTPFDNITVYPKLTQDLLPDDIGGPYNLGSSSKVWDTMFLSTLDVDGVVQIDNNTIQTLTTDTDLVLSAAGTGKVNVKTTDVSISNDLTVDNNLTVNGDTSLQEVEITGTTTLVGNLDQTGDTYITGLFANHNISIVGDSYLEVPNVNIYSNIISDTVLGNNLTFTADGTGGVVFDNSLKIVNSTISNVWPSATNDTQKSIFLTPAGSGTVVINTTKSLKIPTGSNTSRILNSNGEIRFNTQYSKYEGFDRSGNVSFYGIYSNNKQTYITPELTPGANDNKLRFATNNSVKATIDISKLYSNITEGGNVKFSSNNISNASTSTDLELINVGSGSTVINNISFKDNTITNPENSAFTLYSTGAGYIKFAGTGAVVIPQGTSSERNSLPELGETRLNSDLGYMEVYSGDVLLGDNGWIPCVGPNGPATLSEIEETLNIYSLILG